MLYRSLYCFISRLPLSYAIDVRVRFFCQRFGAWPEMTITRTALIYGGRVLPGVANGALFALGTITSGEAPIGLGT